MIYKDIKVNSNLGYVDNMTVTMELVYTNQENRATLEFKIGSNAGFKTECKYLYPKKDDTGAQLLTYSYEGYNNETHYLHVRLTDDVIYCQTVQTGASAGGSTWKINR